MEQEKVMIQARQQDPAAAAAIVKCIVELERDYKLAEHPLSERFMGDVEVLMRKTAPEPWEIVKNDWTVLLKAGPDWKPTRGLGNGDCWLEISEIPDQDEEEHTWIGVAVGAGQSKFGLELVFRNALKQSAVALSQDKAHAAMLEKIGFRRDVSGLRLYLPITIDRLRLSMAFGENDLDQALGPITAAVQAVVAAKADLDKLIEAVRTKAKAR